MSSRLYNVCTYVDLSPDQVQVHLTKGMQSLVNIHTHFEVVEKW